MTGSGANLDNWLWGQSRRLALGPIKMIGSGANLDDWLWGQSRRLVLGPI